MKAWFVAGWAAACALGASCRGEPPEPPAPLALAAPLPAEPEPIAPVPAAPRQEPALVALGALLFESTLLSDDGQVSCASCHVRDRAYTDGLPRSRPASRPAMATNTPSLLNVAALDIFNWNGRYTSLEEHLDALIVNPGVQATSWAAIAERLSQSPELRARFAALFPDGVSAANARVAVLAFERSLTSPDAAFDRWLTGDTSALSGSAQRGYALFKSYGCVSCHQGALVGGNLFARLGVLRPYPGDDSGGDSGGDSDRVAGRDDVSDVSRAADDRRGELGRMEVTGLEQDRFVFRVPSLRNVALTAPYLHDGSVPTLGMAVSVMANFQLGRPLDAAQIEDVVAFLESLTGTIGELEP